MTITLEPPELARPTPASSRRQAVRAAPISWVQWLVAALLVGQAMLALAGVSFPFIVAALVVFFTAFNLLEATLPSLISKFAPAAVKGTAVGVYSSVQFLGTFVGAAAGGWLSEHRGPAAVFGFCLVLTTLWLAASATMSAPPAINQGNYSMGET